MKSLMILFLSMIIFSLADEGCKDISKEKQCQKWLKKGKCSKLWAIKKCPKTCGNCCEDMVKAKKCQKWKSKGKCSKKWVEKKCPKTCELCNNNGTTTTTTTTTPTTTTTTTTTVPTTTTIQAAEHYYVAPNGSGGDGTASNPWKGLKTAINKIRPHGGSPGPEDQAVLHLMSGVYYMSSIQWLQSHHSYVDFVADEGEDVIISGGTPDDNLSWTKEGDILTARFAGSCPSEAFYGSYRLLPARGPNIEKWSPNTNIAGKPYHIITDLLEETDDCTRDSDKFSQKNCPEINHHGFILKDEISEDWDYLEQTQVLIFHAWIAEYVKVANVTDLGDGRKKVMFQEPLQHASVGEWVKSGGWRFLLLNNLALLDAPGEYVCVEDNGEVIFSYIPPGDEPNSKVIMSNIEQMITLSGASNIKFQGLKFQHASQGGKDGYRWGEESVLRILKSSDITIEDCEFSHLGSIGIHFKQSSNILIQNNVFNDIGYHAISSLFNSFAETQENIMIRNNLCDGAGISRYWQPACIVMMGSNNISAIHNELTNVPNHLLAIRGDLHGKSFWSDKGVTHETATKDDYVFHVEYNHCHDYGLGILSDYGGIYMGGGKISNGGDCKTAPLDEFNKKCFTYAHIYNNLIHDVVDYKKGGTFIYSDEGSSGNNFENNVMYGSGGNAMTHHCGVGNQAKNNIVHKSSFTSNHTITRMEVVCKTNYGDALHQEYSHIQNIYLLDTIDEDTAFGNNFDTFENTVYSQNLYWSPQDPQSSLYFSITPGNKKEVTWQEWNAEGRDVDSVWADPKFADSDHGLYTLANDSPAFDLGIQQIDLDNFGIQN